MPENPIKVMKKPDLSLYKSWGNQASNAAGQGWYPESNYDDITVYRSPYGHAFNNVVIPNQKELGHVALFGHNNKTFDIAIRDKTGQVVSYIHKGISPDQVQQYITNSNSTVAQRNLSVLKGTNQDKWNNGTYAAK